MNRMRFELLMLALIALFVLPSAAQATLGDYHFAVGTGARADTTGATTIWQGVPGSGGIQNQVVTIPIGFTFAYDYQIYTQLSISSNGVLGFGATPVTSSPVNDLATSTMPIVAPFWDELRIAGGRFGCFTPRVSWRLSGTQPDRVLIIDYDNVEVVRISGAPTRGQFQVRLYEGSNTIEFWYGRMIPCNDCGEDFQVCANTSASIGLANGTDNFLSITPMFDTTATASTTVANNNVNLNGDNSIESGRVYSMTPGFRLVDLSSNQQPVGPGSPLFVQTNACVGEVALSVPLTIDNPGSLPMTVRSLDILRLDSTFFQGNPSLRPMRDERNRTIASRDYVITSTPGGAPIQTNQPLATPIVIGPDSSRTVYVTFVGQEPGRRLSRLYVRTDASGVSGVDSNFIGFDMPPTITEGLVIVDLVAEAIGPWFAASVTGLKIRPVVFPDTKAGDTSYAQLIIANAGACDLRIDRRRFRIFSGDVHEFAIAQRFRHMTFDAAGNEVLAPGMTDTMVFRFTPVRSGTRLATVFIQTNDSSISLPGLTERGALYVDLFGRGRAGLDARKLVLRPVIVGSFVNGIATLENSSITSVDIASITFSGGDSAEFSQDLSNPWPNGQIRVLAGGVLNLGVRLTPVGDAGVRRTTMIIVTTTGDTVRVPIQGEAGTRQLVISPLSLFENVTLTVGGSVRQTIMISNVGTLPIRLQLPVLSGVDSANYLIGPMPRLDLDPGQTEFLEVTFAPTAAGESSAQILFASNAGADIIVTLGGSATRVRRDRDDDMRIAPGDVGHGVPGQASQTRPTLR